MALLQFTDNPPLSLYIHLPWCVEKCPYCDFNSHGLKGRDLPEAEYVDALLRDLEPELPLTWGRPIETIFLGGGTPSLFSPEALDRLMSGLRALLDLRFTREVTLEVNPGTDMASRLAEYRAIGFNRVSIGVQSFNDRSLERLGRIHDRRAAWRTIEAAHDAGLDSFNIDLMHGLPGQTEADGLADVETALSLEPPHLSWYQLTIEPNTAFAFSPPALPPEATLDRIGEAGRDRLIGAGYEHYEISAFAQPDHACQHNLNYWQFGDYLGIGAGAHGKLTLPAENRIERRVRSRHPNQYLELAGQSANIDAHDISRQDLPFEFMLNALRLTEGFPVSLFQERTGMPIAVVSKTLRGLEDDGLIEWDIQTIRPTDQGLRFLNDVLGRFLPDGD
ncbi:MULTISPECIES: radical SAM family heme chaperone HemW [unclassified Guyparkeria]|uniref:radical SAM family heme chaperone HemW n=1 Tax=unclassified Guyparkeria TaxID=2626246 RepID=UPI000AED3264|nr:MULTISPECIES: radical SAM family heme chaperone HemW [unclassified Guyparkeria]